MGNAEEFDNFYAGSSRRVLGQVYVMVGNHAEAEDAVAEAYLRAWDRWGKVRNCESPEAWVRRVAYRIAVSAWRKAINRLRAHHQEANDDHVNAISEDHVALVKACARSPPISAEPSSCTISSVSASSRSPRRSALPPIR